MMLCENGCDRPITIGYRICRDCVAQGPRATHIEHAARKVVENWRGDRRDITADIDRLASALDVPHGDLPMSDESLRSSGDGREVTAELKFVSPGYFSEVTAKLNARIAELEAQVERFREGMGATADYLEARTHIMGNSTAAESLRAFLASESSRNGSEVT